MSKRNTSVAQVAIWTAIPCSTDPIWTGRTRCLDPTICVWGSSTAVNIFLQFSIRKKDANLKENPISYTTGSIACCTRYWTPTITTATTVRARITRDTMTKLLKGYQENRNSMWIFVWMFLLRKIKQMIIKFGNNPLIWENEMLIWRFERSYSMLLCVLFEYSRCKFVFLSIRLFFSSININE